MYVIKYAPPYGRKILSAVDSVLYQLRGDNIVRGSIQLTDNILMINGTEIDITKGVHVIGFGKAAGEMALGLHSVIGEKLLGGVINTDHYVSVPRIKVNITSHPYPNNNTVERSREIIDYLRLHSDEYVIFLVSGGASSLFEIPRISLEDYRRIMEKLMRVGANIEEINTVRVYLSQVKGGKMLQEFRGECISLIISDVVNPLFVGSGPTYSLNVSRQDVQDILRKYSINVELPAEYTSERECRNFVIADNFMARSKLAYVLNANIVEDTISGDVSEICEKIASYPTGIHVFGGETTVNLEGEKIGKGGRNQEISLRISTLIDDGIFLSIGTDGIDGNTDAAGAMVNESTPKILEKMGVNISEVLRNHDSYFALKKTNALIFTGPTGTNVADLMVLFKK